MVSKTLSNDKKYHPGDKIKDDNDDFVQAEEWVKDRIKGLPGNWKPLALCAIDKIRGH